MINSNVVQDYIDELLTETIPEKTKVKNKTNA